MIQYLLDFEEAYVEYDHVERTQAMKENRSPVLDTDNQRREKLLEKLFHETSLRNTIRQCRSENKSYHEAIEYFNDEALTVYHFDHQLAKTRSRSRHAHMTATQGTEDLDDFQAYLMSRIPSQFMIPKDLYYCISEHA